MVDTDALNRRIKESGYRTGYILDNLGISRAVLSNRINNKSPFKAEEIEMLERLLRLSSKESKRIFFAKKLDKK